MWNADSIEAVARLNARTRLTSGATYTEMNPALPTHCDPPHLVCMQEADP